MNTKNNPFTETHIILFSCNYDELQPQINKLQNSNFGSRSSSVILSSQTFQELISLKIYL